MVVVLVTLVVVVMVVVLLQVVLVIAGADGGDDSDDEDTRCLVICYHVTSLHQFHLLHLLIFTLPACYDLAHAAVISPELVH